MKVLALCKDNYREFFNMIDLSYTNKHGEKADNTNFLGKEELPKVNVTEATTVVENEDAKMKVGNDALDGVSEAAVISESETKKKKTKKESREQNK